ncbi:MAG: HAD family hydrolase [Clostridia bacterium]|nr:HAD family hydrolase [Clostridia bacterium]
MSLNRFKDRILVCDMDGTLLDSKQKVSPTNLDAIRRFVQGGGFFTLATGRDEKAIAPFMELLPVNLPVIIYNGAALYDFKKDKILWCSWLPDSVRETVQELMIRFPELGVMVFKRSSIYFLKENYYTDALIQRDSVEPHYASIDEIPLPWTKVILAWDPECHKKQMENHLDSLKLPFRHVYSQPDFIEFLNNEATKGTALSQLSKLTGIPKSHIVSMGDNMNDLEMIQYAGAGIAVSNAHEDLKKCADLCCCHHEENAVAQVIDWMETGKI